MTSRRPSRSSPRSRRHYASRRRTRERALRRDSRARLAAWNAGWARVGTARGDAAQRLLATLRADVLCVTESFPDAMPTGGHVCSSSADYGYPLRPGRRKVVLWSRSTWASVDETGHPDLPPGRYVSGVTRTQAGEIQIMGVCIPWREAHVRTGRRDRAPWQDHLAFLRGLELLLKARDELPVVVLGDFNQRIPRARQPVAVAEALARALEPLAVVTSGALQGLTAPTIDHIAVSDALSVIGVEGVAAKAARLSDHDAVFADIAPRESQDR